jgi:acetylornithine deacetylase/succinyl-diaminopimelate desuccinylase-like protein
LDAGMSDLQAETIEVLQRLIRFNTVNPPGNERPAIDYLEQFLSAAGFETEILGADPHRPNLVATLSAGSNGNQGPTMVYLGHVDTVLANAGEWRHDPWSGTVAEGYLWGRGAIDMKNQVAAEAVAGATLARAGWRPQNGALKLVFVADEETGGEYGAQYLCQNHPDKVRCDLLLNEGGGGVFEFGGRRRYGICCAEKGIFRFKVTARGIAGHASMPRTGDNALLKLAPVLQKLADAPPSFVLTEAPTALLEGLGLDAGDPERSLATIGAESAALQILLEPMLGVTLTPTMAEASQKINVIPSRASLKIDCRVPPGLGEDAALERLNQVLGEELVKRLEVEFTEKVFGNGSPVQSELTAALGEWIAEQDPGAATVPLILPGFSDSSHFRAAFPDCAAYGFFPQRHQPLLESAPLMHNADERIDVRDLGFAAGCYVDIARRLLG